MTKIEGKSKKKPKGDLEDSTKELWGGEKIKKKTWGGKEKKKKPCNQLGKIRVLYE